MLVNNISIIHKTYHIPLLIIHSPLINLYLTESWEQPYPGYTLLSILYILVVLCIVKRYECLFYYSHQNKKYMYLTYSYQHTFLLYYLPNNNSHGL